MSTHAFTVPDERLVPEITNACHVAIRWPSSLEYDGTTLTLTFAQDLTGPQETLLADVVRAARSILTRAEWQAIDADVVGLRAYLGLASPTNAQTVAATKAIIRVLATIIRG